MNIAANPLPSTINQVPQPSAPAQVHASDGGSRPPAADQVEVSSKAKALASDGAPDRPEPDGDRDDKQQVNRAVEREAVRGQTIAAKAQRVDLMA